MVNRNMDDNDDSVDDRDSKEKISREDIYLTCFKYLMVR